VYVVSYNYLTHRSLVRPTQTCTMKISKQLLFIILTLTEVVAFDKVSFVNGTLPILRRLQVQRKRCFKSGNELRTSVVKYLEGNINVKIQYGRDIGDWCVKNVKDFSSLFCGSTSFYCPFYNPYGETFNADISRWNTSSATMMDYMFGFSAFNKDISKWDVSSVSDMSSMFDGAESFNKDISKWDVSSVTKMSGMFRGAVSFNQDISKWNVLSVTDMSSMFNGAVAFNKDISKWDVSSVTDVSFMFNSAVFNKDISKWDVSSVTDMTGMFFYAQSFNKDISKWDVSSVTKMSAMFNGAVFNYDISKWDVSSVTDMTGMFSYSTSFNQDISNWNVESVTDISYMFNNAISFNQSLCKWTKHFSAMPSATLVFEDSGCSNTTSPTNLSGPFCSNCAKR
jgi:surface protein